MPKITIDDIEYNSEDLSDNGKAQLASLQFLEQQMAKLKNEIAIYQTARAAYAQALKAELEKTNESA
jgi:recombinational DNA repair ATPase RecF